MYTRSGPKWLSGRPWRPPGASWAGGEAQEGGLGGKGSLLFFLRRPKKFFFELPGSILGTSWRLLGRFWVLFPPPGGWPGEAPGGHFWRFCETCSPRGEKERKILIFVAFLVPCSMLFLSSVACLAACFAASRKLKKYEKNNWFLWVARGMRLFRAKAEAIKF